MFFCRFVVVSVNHFFHSLIPSTKVLFALNIFVLFSQIVESCCFPFVSFIGNMKFIASCIISDLSKFSWHTSYLFPIDTYIDMQITLFVNI